jgi:hypothetical protein
MWRTPSGDRVLAPAEWALFREGMSSLWDWTEDTFDDTEPYETGVRVFDRLQLGQQLALLGLVGRALSDPSVPTPRHTAANEAAIAAVFAHIHECVHEEVELDADEGGEGSHQYLREWILAAFREADPEYDEPLPDLEPVMHLRTRLGRAGA